MPRLRKTRASSLLMSSSSLGTRRGRYSTMVISLPKLLKMEPNSTPTAPAPITTMDLGIWGRARISMLVRMRSASASTPGNMRASEPVAITTFFAWTVLLLTIGGFDRDGVNALFRRPGEPAVALDVSDLVLAHEEVEALHVLGDDPVLALQDGLPVDGDLAHAFDAVLGGMLQVVIDLGVEEQGLGRNAAHSAGRCPPASFPARSGRPSTHTARRG